VNQRLNHHLQEVTMKRVLLCVAALVLIIPVTALAGDYHKGATLNCAECHVMHSSQQHGYNANGGGTWTNIGGAPGTYDYLLRNEINELCLTCHDNQTFAPDVLEANGGTAPTTGRLAGGLNMTNVAPYYDADGHTLGSTDVAPGGTFSNADGLNCINCHSAHGRGSTAVPNGYRNLRVNSFAVSYAVGINDVTMDVFERSASGADHYDLGNVDYNEPSQTASAMGTLCQGCHTDFHGNGTSANMRNQLGPAGEEWLRHPTADANIGGIGGGHSSLTVFKNKLYRPKVMTNTNDWGTQGTAWATAPADLTPSCFSCHSAHGNTRSFGLKYMTGAVPIDENGDGAAYRDLCKACHTQGS
jgi:hypothetical protein